MISNSLNIDFIHGDNQGQSHETSFATNHFIIEKLRIRRIEVIMLNCDAYYALQADYLTFVSKILSSSDQRLSILWCLYLPAIIKPDCWRTVAQVYKPSCKRYSEQTYNLTGVLIHTVSLEACHSQSLYMRVYIPSHECLSICHLSRLDRGASSILLSKTSPPWLIRYMNKDKGRVNDNVFS